MLDAAGFEPWAREKVVKNWYINAGKLAGAYRTQRYVDLKKFTDKLVNDGLLPQADADKILHEANEPSVSGTDSGFDSIAAAENKLLVAAAKFAASKKAELEAERQAIPNTPPAEGKSAAPTPTPSPGSSGAGGTGNKPPTNVATGGGGDDDDNDKVPRRATNPKHHPNSDSPEPSNVQELFDNSIADASGVRWAKDQNGVIHRFTRPSNGESHWNGSTAGPNPIQQQNIPSAIRRALR
jgi:hypothetical protein